MCLCGFSLDNALWYRQEISVITVLSILMQKVHREISSIFVGVLLCELFVKNYILPIDLTLPEVNPI